MSYLNRLNAGKYRETDVAQFYIEQRYDHGPFIREVGDFVAHRKRDKGMCFSATAYAYSQVAFFQRYQGNEKRDLMPIGECEWWLKPYFMGKLNNHPPHLFKKELKLSKKEIKEKVLSWFPDGEQFPTRIEALNPFEFWDIANCFCKRIHMPAAFEKRKVVQEVKSAFSRLGIKSVNIDDFIVATAIVLGGREVELANGVTARISICVNKTRHIKLPGLDPELEKSGGYRVIMLPDGPLEINVATKTPKSHDLVDVGLTLLETEVDTEPYFDRTLVRVDKHKIPRLELDCPLSFDTETSPQVIGP